ncbi:MAG: ATP-binding protein [Nitrospira sp.]
MNELATWQAANDHYLSEALAWLRARLERLAERAISEPKAMEPTERVTRPALYSFGFNRVVTLSGSPAAGPHESVRQGDAQNESPAIPTPPPVTDDTQEHPTALILLGNRFGLTVFERNVLLLCVAMELDTRTASLCARAQGDPSKTYPTFALALALFDDPAWDVLSPERPLRYWRLIEINQPGAQPLTSSALRADERIVNYIKGLNYLDDRLTPLLRPLVGAANDISPSQQQQADAIAAHVRVATYALPVIHLLGTDSTSKRSVAAQAAQMLGLSVYRLAGDVLPTAWAELETLTRLYQRESVLLPIALYLDAQDSEKELPAVTRFLARMSGVVFLDTRDSWSQLGREVLALDVTKPSRAEQKDAWQQALGQGAGSAPELLAGQFNLTLPDIQRIAKVAAKAAAFSTTSVHTPGDTAGTPDGMVEKMSGGRQPLVSQVWDACLMVSRPRLDTLAQRLEVNMQTWDDLVLPDSETKLLRQIMDQVGQRHLVYERWGFNRRMSRGLGINALFAGESGTGKTLAAEVIAHELRLNLYRIDLSQVVNKYIGETEKNLRKLFDAAEDGGAILFFDEADALFGKRSEVKDSHDRFANIEINYLLQRMEAYRGLAILATNMKSALDPAFLRRLRFIVNFPFPGIAERKRIWERVFPKDTEKEALDYDRLAKFNLAGGSIQNIALNAAFLAASAGSQVTMPLIFEAARSEFRKLEKPINEVEFRLMQSVAGQP